MTTQTHVAAAVKHNGINVIPEHDAPLSAAAAGPALTQDIFGIAVLQVETRRCEMQFS